MSFFNINPKSSHGKNHVKSYLNTKSVQKCFLHLQWEMGRGSYSIPELGYVIQPKSLRSSLGYMKKEIVEECVCTSIFTNDLNSKFKLYVTDSYGPDYHLDHLPGSSIKDYTGYFEIYPFEYGENGPSVWDIANLLKEHYTYKVQKFNLCGCYDPVYFAGLQPVRDGVGCLFVHDYGYDKSLQAVQ